MASSNNFMLPDNHIIFVDNKGLHFGKVMNVEIGIGEIIYKTEPLFGITDGKSRNSFNIYIKALIEKEVISKIKKLLRIYNPGLVIKKSELIAVNEYLFNGFPVAPMFKNNELFETVEYLKDLVETEEISQLHDLFAYLTKKRKKMGKFIDDLIKNTNSDYNASDPETDN